MNIYDVTNPAHPTPLAEDVGDATGNGNVMLPQILQSAPANLTEAFLHDMIVKPIDSRQVILMSHCDAGYVTADVTDVHAPWGTRTSPTPIGRRPRAVTTFRRRATGTRPSSSRRCNSSTTARASSG